MTDDINFWAGAEPGTPSDTVERCEAILPEWPSITEAALLAHQGLPKEAEKSRERGGYGNLGTW